VSRILFLAIAACVALTACSSDKDREPGLMKQATGAIKSRFLRQETTPPPTRDQLRAAITPEFREQTGGVPLLLVTSQRVPVSSILTRFSVNGPVETYLTPDQISLSLRDGIVVSSRGLGNDLMSAEVTGVLDAIRAGEGSALRRHRYLDGENQEVIDRFTCDYSRPEDPAGTVIERCRGSDQGFTNSYALDQDGRITLSNQWISPGLQSYLIEDIR
jgi:hypothetical protein